MALKDLLVVVDDTAASAERVALAARLAVAHDAHLTGLYIITHTPIPAFIEAEIPESVRLQQQATEKAMAEKAAGLFDEAVRRNGLTGRSEWRALAGDPTQITAVHGRYSDLIIVGQVNPARVPDLPVPLPEDLVFDAGRPILVVPYAGTFPTMGERVLIGWNASREAARAVGDAMPILAKSKRLTVMAVNPAPGANGLGDEPGADIARHLARHFNHVEAAHISTRAIEPGDTILNAVADDSCDLVVMGAYGRSRLRELVLGGMTRYMLQHMTVPVLMSH